VLNASAVCQTRTLIGRVSSMADWRVHGALVVSSVGTWKACSVRYKYRMWHRGERSCQVLLAARRKGEAIQNKPTWPNPSQKAGDL
jgi:hypothetical protein